MTHAERVQEAERAVVDAAKKWARCLDYHSERECMSPLRDATYALLYQEMTACPTCKGHTTVAHLGQFSIPCPANCDNGRRREG